MGVWTLTEPADTEPANTLGTLVQNARADIRERLTATTALGDDRHSFEGADVTGRHPLSLIGWLGDWASLGDLVNAADAGSIPNNSLHYISDLDAVDAGIYVIRDYTPELVNSNNHLNGFINVSGNGGHTQYLMRDGSTPMTGNLAIRTLLISNSSEYDPFGAQDDKPLSVSHVLGSWGVKHGDGSLVTRHVPDDSVGLAFSMVNPDGYRTTAHAWHTSLPHFYYELDFEFDLQDYALFPQSITLVSNGNPYTIQAGSSIQLKATSTKTQLRIKTYYSGDPGGLIAPIKKVT